MVTQCPEAPTLTAYAQLTTKQRLFVDHYIESNNGRQSAIKAGYPPKSAGSIAVENLTKTLIKQALQEKFQAVANREPDLTPDYVRKEIKATIPMCTAPKDRIACLELLGKAVPGTFEPVAPSTIGTMNVFAVLAKLAQPAPQALRLPNTIPSDVVDVTATPHPSPRTSAPPTADVLDITPEDVHPLPYIEKTATDAPALDVAAVSADAGGDPVSPPAGVDHSNTLTQKNLQQNLGVTTPEVLPITARVEEAT